ncbi:carbamate kinase [Actinobaculum suis]|uniref:carbamate kinase n=1 Tax=Actinobaculum suis TaxID=1657 RepID=UPI00080875CE|nr:carbamate kinase [Actinobaculum suis]OCA93705.1 carbamate kinase [Actinobaculum suis]OCA93998.1 carbamate kinase [Actinobaculum suis]
MSKERIVVALGGNALGNTPETQLRLAASTARNLVDLIALGAEIIITHGNGPQVGMIKVATDFAAQAGHNPHLPFAECGAMSQGYIGYHLQQCIDNELRARGIAKPCAAIATQTVVDAADPAFAHPTKPVGAFYTETQARALAAETGNTYVNDAGRGWRWVVASPQPVEIVEAPVIATLVEAGVIVIAAGGGGGPVVDNGTLAGTAAVVDKDRTAALLASQLQADTLLILTAIDAAYRNYGTPAQERLAQLTVSAAQKACENGEFAAGSMLPKVEACVQFVQGHPHRRAIITSLEKAAAGLAEKCGTIIHDH